MPTRPQSRRSPEAPNHPDLPTQYPPDPSSRQAIAAAERKRNPSGLTDLQERLARGLVEDGLTPRAAALQAGYSPQSSEQSWARLLASPRFSTYVELLTRRLLSSAAPLAVNTLITVLADPDAHTQARVRAAEVLLDRAGFKPAERYENVTASGALTPTELRQRAAELLDEMRRREEAKNAVEDTEITHVIGEDTA